MSDFPAVPFKMQPVVHLNLLNEGALGLSYGSCDFVTYVHVVYVVGICLCLHLAH